MKLICLCKINLCCHNFINSHCNKVACLSYVFLRSMQAFFKKTRATDLQIFVTFFDKTKSQKRWEKMLGEPSGKPVLVILPYCISCLMIPDDLSFMPVSASVYAHIRV